MKGSLQSLRNDPDTPNFPAHAGTSFALKALAASAVDRSQALEKSSAATRQPVSTEPSSRLETRRLTRRALSVLYPRSRSTGRACSRGGKIR
jgi:hypothetical protein